MNNTLRNNNITLSITAVERDTGLSKDTLRVWERRYGFPAPERDAIGERAYPLDQVEKLRVVKRLLDVGHRPGRVVALPMDDLQLLVDRSVDTSQRAALAPQEAVDLRDYLALVRSHDTVALRGMLTQRLLSLGISRFVLEIAAPLSTAVGEAWMRGEVEVFEEHAVTEILQSVLRLAITSTPATENTAQPRVLLSTFPGEPHGLGLLMAEAMLAIEGCHCISLGVQTPVWDTVRAATAYRADIVALSFSGCMGPNQVVDGLSELAAKLPQGVQVWAGGSAPVLHRRTVARVRALASLGTLTEELQAWREAAAEVPAS